MTEEKLKNVARKNQSSGPALKSDIVAKSQNIDSIKVTDVQYSATSKSGITDKDVPKDWEDRYQDLFDHARDLIHIYGPDGRFIAVNKRWCEILGYSKEEALKMSLPDIVHPDLLAACLATFVNFDKGISYTAFESMFVAKDGHTVYVTGNMVPYLEKGELVRTRHIFTDVSFNKQAET